MDTIATGFVVHGRVQGVWFRASTQQAARRLGVKGWVRNESDGTVRGHAEGDPAALAALLRFLHEGPELARVERVDTWEAEVEGAQDFEVRRP